MSHRSLLRLSAVLVACGFIVSLAAGAQDSTKRGRKYKTPPPTARIEVTVLRDANDKPIENAAVIFHPMEGERDKGAMELKTNEDGKTVIDVLPIGDVVRLQIIAKGYQTYGEDYKIDKTDIDIEIKMKRPGQQYSIYEKHDGSEIGGKDPDTKPAPPPANAPPAAAPAPASDPKTDDTNKPQDAQPPSK
jgi:hypothetical protein